MLAEINLENEKLVFNVIQEYLDKNRYFNLEKIVPFISSRFAKASININDDGIKVILKSLVKKNLIVERSKLIREDVLINLNRKEIYDLIKRDPGIYFNKIVNELQLSIPVVEWHINILLKFNFIRKEKFDNFEAYFEEGIKDKDAFLVHIISRDKCNKIIEYFKNNNEGSTKNQVYTVLGMHPNTIKKYMDMLHEFGLLYKKVSKNKTLYFLNEQYYYKIYNRFFKWKKRGLKENNNSLAR